MKKDYSIYEVRVFIYVLVNGSVGSYSEVARGYKDSNRAKYEKPLQKLIDEKTLKKNCFNRYMFDYNILGKSDNPDIKKLQNPIDREQLKEALNSNKEAREKLENLNKPENMAYFEGRLQAKENASPDSIKERLDKVREAEK